MEAQAMSGICGDAGNDSRSPVAHSHCTGQVLEFTEESVQRSPCSCECHQGLVKAALLIASDYEPKEVICSRCKALLEDGPADSEQELDFEENFSMDRSFARMVDGLVVCQLCHWSQFGGLFGAGDGSRR